MKRESHFLSHCSIYRAVCRPGVKALGMEYCVSELCDRAWGAITKPRVPERRKAKTVLDAERAKHLFRFLRTYRSFVFELPSATHDNAV